MERPGGAGPDPRIGRQPLGVVIGRADDGTFATGRLGAACPSSGAKDERLARDPRLHDATVAAVGLDALCHWSREGVPRSSPCGLGMGVRVSRIGLANAGRPLRSSLPRNPTAPSRSGHRLKAHGQAYRTWVRLWETARHVGGTALAERRAHPLARLKDGGSSARTPHTRSPRLPPWHRRR